MRKLALTTVIFGLILPATSLRAQTNVPDVEGHCVELVCPDGRRLPCNGTCSLSAGSPSVQGVNPATAAAINAAGATIDEALFKLIFGGNKQNDAATAAQEAAAKAAEQQRIQQEMERQRMLAEQRRQRIYNRVNGILAASGLGTISTPGISMNDVESMIGSDKPGIGPEDMKAAMGAGFDTPAQSATAPTTQQSQPWGDPNVVDLRDCGGPSSPCPTPTGDFGSVDLQSVQQGVDLAVVASSAPAGDQQAVLDQALAASNGDKTIQITLTPSASVPVVSQDGLLEFQKANAVYRKARDTQYQFENAFEQAQKRRVMADAIVKASQAQMIINLQKHSDEMTLAQQYEALGKIFQAGLEYDVAYGDEDAKLALALQNTDWARFQAEGVLARIAHVQPPPAPSAHGLTNADLQLHLPDQPVAPPSKADMKLVEDSILPQPIKLPAEVVRNYPPAVALKYKSDPAFEQQMNQMHASIYSNLQKDYRTAAQEADESYHKQLAGLIQKGAVKANVPLDAQESANPQLHLQLQNIRKEITSRLDYECTMAHYEAENSWSSWVATQNANLTGKPAPLYRPFP